MTLGLQRQRYGPPRPRAVGCAGPRVRCTTHPNIWRRLARAARYIGGPGQARWRCVASMESSSQRKATMSLEDSPSECVSDLAKAAGLPLPPERVAQVESVLSAWRADALRLPPRINEGGFHK